MSGDIYSKLELTTDVRLCITLHTSIFFIILSDIQAGRIRIWNKKEATKALSKVFELELRIKMFTCSFT